VNRSRQRNYGELWRAVKWGQVGNLTAWAVALGGIGDSTALTLGAAITLIFTFIGT
jgi:hypothetical protein